MVNTLMTNLLARQQELGILQSVGMSGKQVSRMLIPSAPDFPAG